MYVWLLRVFKQKLEYLAILPGLVLHILPCKLCEGEKGSAAAARWYLRYRKVYWTPRAADSKRTSATNDRAARCTAVNVIAVSLPSSSFNPSPMRTAVPFLESETKRNLKVCHMSKWEIIHKILCRIVYQKFISSTFVIEY
jgi:hypothetical protein